MVLKCTRNRRQVPLKMITELVSELKDQWAPVQKINVEEFSEDEGVMDQITEVYYIKSTLLDKVTYRIDSIRYHLGSFSDPTKTACRRLKIEDCQPVGTVIPDESMLCTQYKRARSYSL